MDDLVQRLHSLSHHEHDDLSIGNEAADAIERLTAERDALQADAARYRWLRDMDEDPICSLAAMWTDCKGSALSISKRVDAAVDAARGKNTT